MLLPGYFPAVVPCTNLQSRNYPPKVLAINHYECYAMLRIILTHRSLLKLYGTFFPSQIVQCDITSRSLTRCARIMQLRVITRCTTQRKTRCKDWYKVKTEQSPVHGRPAVVPTSSSFSAFSSSCSRSAISCSVLSTRELISRSSVEKGHSQADTAEIRVSAMRSHRYWVSGYCTKWRHSTVGRGWYAVRCDTTIRLGTVQCGTSRWGRVRHGTIHYGTVHQHGTVRYFIFTALHDW